jgi:hypothetical protein
VTSYVRYHSGEWSALYVDGELVKYGDHYLVDEWLASHLGVEDLYNDDFLLPDGRTVLSTLHEVEVRTADREARLSAAEELRAQAEVLRRKAEDLEKGA